MPVQIQPSQFYYVRDNNSFKACVILMKEKGLSFLLIENHVGKLVGIFTLKDLLKHHMVLSSEMNSKKSIRSFMSKPVLTIPAHKIVQAPKIMIDSGIRHLPITSDRPGEELRIIGVVDMESLLKHSLSEEKNNKYKAKDISIYSPNGSLLRLMKNALKKYDLLQTDKLWASQFKSESHFVAHCLSYDLFFFDITEEKDLKFAIRFAPFVNRSKKRMICLVGPETFRGKPLEKDLQKLAKASRVKVFHKPLDVHDLIFECLS